MATPQHRKPGAPALTPELRRDRRVVMHLRAGESDDLSAYADAWGIPAAVAAWAIVATELGRARRRAPLVSGSDESGRNAIALAEALHDGHTFPQG